MNLPSLTRFRTRHREFFLALLLYLLFPGFSAAAVHYVSPGGTSKGDGSLEHPWDLQTALNQPASVQPGDTIWLRSGTYISAISDGFTSKLHGTPASPIVVRNYNGERATIDGQLNYMGLDVTGSYTWYWGLEIMSSCELRVIAQTTGICAIGVGAFGPGNKFINLIVHDTTQGFSGYNAAPDNEFYGNLTYYNGFVGPDRNHGHGMYFQNITGTKTIADNIIGDNADEGIQIYGSGNASLINFVVSGNTIYNNSSWPSSHYQYNLIIAGGQTRKNITVDNNFSYYPPNANAEGFAAQFGQYGAGQDVTVTNNIFADGYAPVAFTEQDGPVTFTGNTIVASADSLRPVTLDLLSQQKLTTYSWDKNTYYDQSSGHFFRGVSPDGNNFSGSGESFASWQSHTGFDAHSIYKQAAPTGFWTFVRPNKYEAKRANITIFNWDRAKSVSVDLSSVLKRGDRYVIHDAQNFYGSPVASGVYAGAPVAIPMTGLAKAAPVGFAAPAHTAPQFGTFILLPGASPPPSTSPRQ